VEGKKMPIYLYRNLKTGKTFEIEQRMVDDALTVDPVTGDPVKRLIQPVGIVFKGSGFYVNDSRGESSTAVPSAAGDGASAGKNEAAAAGTAAEPAPAAGNAAPAPASGSTPATASKAPGSTTQNVPGK
jgi:predicted nucleic acid-binding Zn ribbon protein